MDAEIQTKDREIAQAKAMLTSIHTEITESSRTLATLSTQIAPLDDARRELEQLQAQLRAKISEDLKKGYEQWTQGEKGREGRWRAGQDPGMNNEDYSDLNEKTQPAAEGEEEALQWEIEDLRRGREALVGRLVKAEAEVGTLKLLAGHC
jgi:chromosome segregation ATPase